MTFRTECSADNERVPALIEALGVQLRDQKVLSDEIATEYKMGEFTIEVPNNYSVEEFRSRMQKTIDNNKQFVDMHRCFQTLKEGTEHDKEWFKR